MEQNNFKKNKTIKFIENPLPGPKPHVRKEMTYDYEVPADKMHFDNENPVNNFYDYQ